ncbi:hypothetical protein [Snodgrassella communis]|nr:hypothetical protein [Snodgrassella communis]
MTIVDDGIVVLGVHIVAWDVTFAAFFSLFYCFVLLAVIRLKSDD